MNDLDYRPEVERPKPDPDFPNEEQSTGHPSMHIYGTDAGGWEVWCNFDGPLSGFIVGQGNTRDGAVGEAVKALESAVNALQGPRPIRG